MSPPYIGLGGKMEQKKQIAAIAESEAERMLLVLAVDAVGRGHVPADRVSGRR